MYPFIRLAKDIFFVRRMPPLAKFTDIHESRHICWPWDLDMFMELNNGRTLTLYDLGRFAAAQRSGLVGALIANKWTMTMAGSNVRYRRRITAFEKFTTKSRVACWDDRFVYLEQSMWKTNGECASHIVSRVAVLKNGKRLDPSEVAIVLGLPPESPPIPEWIAAWIEADKIRLWPPMQDALD